MRSFFNCCHSLRSKGYMTLFSIKLYLGLLSSSSSNCTWSQLLPFPSPDLFSMYSLVFVFLFVHYVSISTPAWQCVGLFVSACVQASICTITGSCPVSLHRSSSAILSNNSNVRYLLDSVQRHELQHVTSTDLHLNTEQINTNNNNH